MFIRINVPRTSLNNFFPDNGNCLKCVSKVQKYGKIVEDLRRCHLLNFFWAHPHDSWMDGWMDGWMDRFTFWWRIYEQDVQLLRRSCASLPLLFFLVLWLYCLCFLFYTWLHSLRNKSSFIPDVLIIYYYFHNNWSLLRYIHLILNFIFDLKINNLERTFSSYLGQ